MLEVWTDSTVIQRFRGFFHQRWEKWSWFSNFIIPGLQFRFRYGMTGVMIVLCGAGASVWLDGKHAEGFGSKVVFFSSFVCGLLVKFAALRGRKSFTTAALRDDFSQQLGRCQH